MEALLENDLIKAKQLAEIAEDVYRRESKVTKGWRRLNNDEIRSLNINPNDFKNILQQPEVKSQGGLRVALYRTDAGELVTAFKGTEVTSAKDWITNLKQGLGLNTRDYSRTIRLAEELLEVPGPKIMTGHSKGGAHATLAAAITDSKAVTFNTAGLHKDSLDRAGLNLDEFKLNKADELIVNYANKGEILQKVNGLRVVPDPLGPKFEIGEEALQGKGAFKRHGMDLVINSLDEAIQKQSELSESLGFQHSNPATQLEASKQFKEKIGDAILQSFNSVEKGKAQIESLREVMGKAYKSSIDNSIKDFAFYGPDAPKQLGAAAALDPSLTAELMTAQAAADVINQVHPAIRADSPKDISQEQMQSLKTSSQNNVYGDTFLQAASQRSPLFRQSYSQAQSSVAPSVQSVTTGKRLSNEQIDTSLMKDAALKNTAKSLKAKIEKIYRDPDKAFNEAVKLASDPKLSPSELRKNIGERPEILGELEPIKKGFFGRIDKNATHSAVCDVKNEAKNLSTSLQHGRKAIRDRELNVSKTLGKGVALPSRELSESLQKFEQNPNLKNFAKGYDVEKLYTQGQNILEKTGDIVRLSGKNGFGIKPASLESVKKLKSTVQKLEQKHPKLTRAMTPKLGPKL